MSHQAPPPVPRRKLTAGRAIGAAIIGLLMILPLSLALFGAWVGSSLAVYEGGPVWLTILVSISTFLVLPLAWEMVADRDQQGGRVRDTILRSAFLSAMLIVVLLVTHPQATFKALATRGDWFLGGSQSETAQSIREALYTMADGLEWIYDMVREKAFRPDRDDTDEIDVSDSTIREWQEAEPDPEEARRRRKVAIPIPGTALSWPLKRKVHPMVAKLPASQRDSIASVATWFAARIEDPFERVKALHDFVAKTVDYDVEGLADGTYQTRQDAEQVFRSGLGVCAGYSRLMVALGQVSGDRIVYIAGDARTLDDYTELPAGERDPVEGVGHAWNAVEIGGHWYLMDVTWDAGQVKGKFKRYYQTTYLFIPPRVMLINHLPDRDKWQMVPAPINRGEWLRLPYLKPSGAALGLELLAPRRTMVEASERFEMHVANPRRYWLMAYVEPIDGGRSRRCGEPTAAERPVIGCRLPDIDRAKVSLFANSRRHGTFDWVGGYVVDVD